MKIKVKVGKMTLKLALDGEAKICHTDEALAEIEEALMDSVAEHYEELGRTHVKTRFTDMTEKLDYNDPDYEVLWNNRASGRSPCFNGEQCVW